MFFECQSLWLERTDIGGAALLRAFRDISKELQSESVYFACRWSAASLAAWDGDGVGVAVSAPSQRIMQRALRVFLR